MFTSCHAWPGSSIIEHPGHHVYLDRRVVGSPSCVASLQFIPRMRDLQDPPVLNTGFQGIARRKIALVAAKKSFVPPKSFQFFRSVTWLKHAWQGVWIPFQKEKESKQCVFVQKILFSQGSKSIFSGTVSFVAFIVTAPNGAILKRCFVVAFLKATHEPLRIESRCGLLLWATLRTFSCSGAF